MSMVSKPVNVSPSTVLIVSPPCALLMVSHLVFSMIVLYNSEGDGEWKAFDAPPKLIGNYT